MRAFKVCGCGRSFSRRGWRELKLVGLQDDGLFVVELRNCPCTSTIAIRVGDSPKRAETLAGLWLEALVGNKRALRSRRGWADVARAWRGLERDLKLVGRERDARIAAAEAEEAELRQIIEEATPP